MERCRCDSGTVEAVGVDVDARDVMLGRFGGRLLFGVFF